MRTRASCGRIHAERCVHSSSQLGPVFDQSIADLRYGCVTINTGALTGFAVTSLPWGGAPGESRMATSAPPLAQTVSLDPESYTTYTT